ncbi:MAG: hypothetical protein JXA17_07205 [Dehalococcoidales bacterium]|nr:hypothetical protein [Dehalococcoidales bacterium]
MKKKLIFGVMVLLALVLTTGTFAYTYTFNSATLGSYMAEGPFATYDVSDIQPDWDSILPEGEYGSEILVPVAAGDDTELPFQYPDSGEHWDKVAEQSPDDLGTYVSTQGEKTWVRDLYNLSNFIGSSGEEAITSVTVYFRFAAGGDYNIKIMAALKSNGEVYEGPTITYSATNFVTESWECPVNPSTGEAWTRDELNDLQAGITARGDSKNNPAIITQVYVQVNYEYSNVQGQVPTGCLFDIYPAPDYTGDLLVKIYLTNTANLLKAYQYINMKIFIANSIEAGYTPDYQILSIETGVIIFNIKGGSAESYTVQITGGSYRLISDDPYEWGTGWTIIPEFYCEVTQR